jgi:hypothetical protein
MFWTSGSNGNARFIAVDKSERVVVADKIRNRLFFRRR